MNLLFEGQPLIGKKQLADLFLVSFCLEILLMYTSKSIVVDSMEISQGT